MSCTVLIINEIRILEEKMYDYNINNAISA